MMKKNWVKDIFLYKNGVLYWKQKPSKGFQYDIKSPAGTTSDKTVVYIHYKNKKYKRSALVWCYFKNKFPTADLYHLNSDFKDDRIENLSPCKKHDPYKARKTSNKHKYIYKKSANGGYFFTISASRPKKYPAIVYMYDESLDSLIKKRNKWLKNNDKFRWNLVQKKEC